MLIALWRESANWNISGKRGIGSCLTFSCKHKMAGNFLICSCFVAFWGVPPHWSQLYASASRCSGDVKLSRQPLRVAVEDGPMTPPIARFFACTWTSRLRSIMGSSVSVVLPHLSQVTVLRSLPWKALWKKHWHGLSYSSTCSSSVPCNLSTRYW